MFVAADFVLGIVCALLTDFETLCVGFAAPIVSGHQQLISSLSSHNWPFRCLDWKIMENFGKLNYNVQRRGQIMEQYLSDRNQLHIFDNDNFSIIPKSIFSDNDNLPISCKNADLSAVDNFFDNIAHPYLGPCKPTPWPPGTQ